MARYLSPAALGAPAVLPRTGPAGTPAPLPAPTASTPPSPAPTTGSRRHCSPSATSAATRSGGSPASRRIVAAEPGHARGGQTRGWRLRLVGVVEVSAADDAWAIRDMGSRKGRTLLALLGARVGRTVAMDQLIDVLWDDRTPRRPEANVATLVSRLRGRFGREVVVGGRGGYRLGDEIQVDLHEAGALATAAEGCLSRGEPRLGLPAAERALELLDRGRVLTEYPSAGWADTARGLQEALLRRARHTAAECALHTAVPTRAQALAASALTDDPLDETACRVFMRACLSTGEPARAMLAYERLRGNLAAELGADPARATRELHLTILGSTS